MFHFCIPTEGTFILPHYHKINKENGVLNFAWWFSSAWCLCWILQDNRRGRERKYALIMKNIVINYSICSQQLKNIVIVEIFKSIVILLGCWTLVEIYVYSITSYDEKPFLLQAQYVSIDNSAEMCGIKIRKWMVKYKTVAPEFCIKPWICTHMWDIS